MTGIEFLKWGASPPEPDNSTLQTENTGTKKWALTSWLWYRVSKQEIVKAEFNYYHKTVP